MNVFQKLSTEKKKKKTETKKETNAKQQQQQQQQQQQTCFALPRYQNCGIIQISEPRHEKFMPSLVGQPGPDT